MWYSMQGTKVHVCQHKRSVPSLQVETNHSRKCLQQTLPPYLGVVLLCCAALCCAVLCRNFTDTALGISLVILNSMIDLVSFSGILYSIYPPLFAALLAYSIGGTVGSIWLGKVSGALPAV
jgi:hypothetical protein